MCHARLKLHPLNSFLAPSLSTPLLRSRSLGVCVCWIGFSLDADVTRQRQWLAAIHDDYSGSYLTCIFLQFNFIVVCNSVQTIFIIIFGLLLSFGSTLYACAATLCRYHKLSPNRSIEYYFFFFACLLVGLRCADRMCNNMVFTFSSYPFYYIFTVVVCSFEAIFQYWFAINGESNAHYWDGANKSSQNPTRTNIELLNVLLCIRSTVTPSTARCND